MNAIEIAGGIVLLVLCIILIIICLMQDSKQQNMTGAISGASTDSYYDQNTGRTKEAILAKVTRALTIIFFVAVLAVNIVPAWMK